MYVHKGVYIKFPFDNDLQETRVPVHVIVSL
jgi:hypothetical protein